MARDALEEITKGDYTIEIYRDDMFTDDSPRSWCNLGTMVCWHNRYVLGDENPMQSPENYLQALEECIILPLYLYDHSGITINTTGFSCPWDSDQVGFIYVSKDDIRKEYNWKYITHKRINQVEEYLRNEVKTYDDYLTGNVYGYVIKDQNDEHVESCWGFYGDYEDGLLSEAEGMVKYLQDEKDKQRRLLQRTREYNVV